MRYVAVALFVLFSGCGGKNTSSPPEEVILSGDTAQVPVLGSGDVEGHELANVRWNEPSIQTRRWLIENGFEHRSTGFDTERMEAIGYETLVSEDQTGVRLFGISTWTRPSTGE